MAEKSQPVSDDQIAAICRSQIDASAGYAGGEISNERAEALDYYYGEPYGDETEGRSQIVTREVMETVEWILPSLTRIFTDVDNMVQFEPVNEDDIEQAKTETEVCNYVFWKQNRGFYNTYTMLKDALLSKTGILKIWWDDADEESKEEYEGLDELQLGELLNDPSVEREILEFEETLEGFNVVFKTTKLRGQIRIEPVPPEEFGIARYARSPYVEDVNFCYHRTQKSFSELIQMGYEPDVIRTLPYDDDVQTAEELSRRNQTDEQEPYDFASEESMRMYWISECYVRIDRDGDNIAELLRVTLAGGHYTASSARLLSIDEVDFMPFACVAPILMPHKFYGMSIADLTMDLQKIKSVLLRSMLDNTYLANNSRTAVNDTKVNLDDLLTSRPGGIVRYKGDGPGSQYIMPIPHNNLPAEAYAMVEYLDDVRKQRTGVGDEVAGLDKNSLANVNTGVAALAFDAARMKIELIARIIAEVGFRDVFRIIHQLLMTHHDRQMIVNIAGEFASINPSEWRERQNTTVTVGVGTVSRERRMVALEAIMQKQNEQIQQGGMGTVVQPHQVYQSLSDMVDAFGLEPTAYFTDPRTVPPPQPKPDVQAELAMTHAKALMMDAESKIQKNQIEAQKMQADMEMKMREQNLKAQEQALKVEIETMKAQLISLQRETDSEQKVASLEIQMDKQETENELKRLELELQAVKAERDQDINLYKNQVDNVTKLMQDQSEPVDLTEMREWIAQLVAQNQELNERLDIIAAPSPRVIQRDEQGLVIQIGDQPVTRDESGMVIQIG